MLREVLAADVCATVQYVQAVQASGGGRQICVILFSFL